MATSSFRLVTIVAERVLEDQLLQELRSLGARGYTLTDVRGEGSRGVRASEWEGTNVKIEVVVAPEVAEKILAHVAQRYFRHYAVIVYVHDVEVVRGDKYT